MVLTSPDAKTTAAHSQPSLQPLLVLESCAQDLDEGLSD